MKICGMAIIRTSLLLPLLVAVVQAATTDEDNNSNTSNLRRHRRLQKEACVMYQRALDNEDSKKNRLEWHCELQGKDRKQGEGRFVRIDGTLDKKQLKQAKSGKTTLQVDTAMVQDETLWIPEGATVVFDSILKNQFDNGNALLEPAAAMAYYNGSNVFDNQKAEDLDDGSSLDDSDSNSLDEGDSSLDDSDSSLDDSSRRNRKLLSGVRKILAIRVEANDKQTADSEASLSDKIFGTAGDSINLSERLETCSHGQVTVEPYSGTTDGGVTIDDDKSVGVVTIKINRNINGQREEIITNEVLEAAENQLGVLKGQFDHVMLCLPPGLEDDEGDREWIGWGYYNHYLTVYNNRWCTYPSMQLHELGHNFGLDHSSETKKEYGDQTGSMGYSTNDGQTLRCYNSAKNWQLKWYMERRRFVRLKTNKGFKGILIGLDDYDNELAGANDKVLIKVEAGRVDYFIGFNLKKGMNDETKEGINRVTIQSQKGKNKSFLKAKLGANSEYTLTNNYKKTGKRAIVSIGVINLKADPPYAKIDIFLR